MASTYSYNDAWTAIKLQYRSNVDQTAFEYATNMAISAMWKMYDWRGSVAPFLPFWLVPGEQDYGAPFAAVPSDFFGLREVYLVQTNGAPVPVRYPLRVVENLEHTHVTSLPNVICYRASDQVFRIHPGAGLGVACPCYFIDGTYKIRPPKITRALSSSVLLWDDVYFETFCAFLTWAALLVGGDKKGAMEQWAIALNFLARDTAVECTELGSPVVSPSEGLLSYGGMQGQGWGLV